MVPQDIEALPCDVPHPSLVYVAHGEYRHPQLFESEPLFRIEFAHAQQNQVLRLELGPFPSQVYQPRIAIPQEMRQGHPVNVAGRRGLGRIAIAVGIDIDHPRRLMMGDAADSADGEGMVAANEYWYEATLDCIPCSVVGGLAYPGNRREVM